MGRPVAERRGWPAPAPAPAGHVAGPADEEIVRRVLRGDKDAHETLVRRHERRVAAHAYRLVRNREQAADIAQEAFLKAFVHLARFDPARRFITWLLAIAGNAAIDHLRHVSARIPETSLDAARQDDDGGRRAHDPVDPAPGAHEVVLGADLAGRLETAIAELPVEHRHLLLMRHPGGKSYDEIAAATGLPMGTVKTRIHRARQQLKLALADVLPANVD